MHSLSRLPGRFLAVAALAVAFAIPQNVPAQASDHIVTPQALNQATQDATQTRQQNLHTLRSLLASPQGKKAMESAHVQPQEVQNAVSSLSDQELAQLASRATKAHNDFAAGNLTDHDLLLIILVLVVVIVLVAVAH